MSEEQKKIIESSSYSFIFTYLNFILNIIGTFLIARLISPEEWGQLILILSFKDFIIFVCSIVPPAGQATLAYFISNKLSDEEPDNFLIRKFISHVYKIRFLGFIIIIIIYLIIVHLLFYGTILYILIILTAPMIFFTLICVLNQSIIFSYQKFKIDFYLNLINTITFTSIIIIIFFLSSENALINISFAYTFSLLIVSIFSILFIIKTLPKIDKKKNKEKIQYRDEFLQLHKRFGVRIVFIGLFSQINSLIINILFLSFNLLTFATYLMICQSAITVILNFSLSNQGNYLPIFTKLNYEKNPETYKSLLYQLHKYLILILCIFIGIIYFFIELYIQIIYSEVYLIILIPAQFFLFNAIGRVFLRVLLVVPHSTNNVRIHITLTLFELITGVSFTLISLLLGNFMILIIFGMIQLIFEVFLLIYLVNKKIGMNLKYFILFKPVLIFLISFFISIPFTLFMNFSFFSNVFFNQLLNRSLKCLIFIFIFYLIIYFTHYITKEDFRQLTQLLPILNSDKSYIKRLTKFIERFLPS